MSYNILSSVLDVIKAGVSTLSDGSAISQIGTTKQKWTDDFGGTSLDLTRWDIETNTGDITYSVANSDLTVNMGTVANAELRLLSKATVTIPVDLSVSFRMSQSIANNEVYFELVEVDPATLLPVDNPNLPGDWNNRTSIKVDGTTSTTWKLANVGEGANVVTEVTQTSMNARSSTVDALLAARPQDTVLTVCGADSLSARSSNGIRVSSEVPDPNKLYKVRMRFRNLATAPASNTVVTVRRVLIMDVQEIAVEIASGRGDTSSGQAIAVNANLMSSTAVIGAVDPNNTLVADITSATITSSSNTTITPTRAGGSAEFQVAVTAVSGTNPTYSLVIQESDDGGTNWYDLWHFPQITSNGIYRTPLLQLTGNRIRYVNTLGGTSPSFTRSISRNVQFFVLAPIRRQFINRTIDPNSAGSATPWFEISGADMLEAATCFTTYGTASTTFAIDVTDDQVSWSELTSFTQTGTGIWRGSATGTAFRFARLRVKTAGTGNVLGGIGARLSAWKG